MEKRVQMNKTEKLVKLFGTAKPVIALLHIEALPGDPFYSSARSLEDIVDALRMDLENLQNGGVDAVLFSNEFSMPYQNKVDSVTTDSMAYIIGRVRDQISIPFGVHVISDGMATIELAAATGASFARGVFTGAFVGEDGLKCTDIAAVLRRKKALGLDDFQMFYMANAEANAYLNDREFMTIVKSLIFKCHPDGICFSGIHAGQEASNDVLDEIREVAKDVAVFANTGCTVDNVAEKLKHCDGAFVGTGFKLNGKFENHTDGVRVKTFMEIVKANR